MHNTLLNTIDIQELLHESISTLTVNKMRTSLAVLGIVIGIASVIALISLGQGSQKSIERQIQSLGTNLLTISPGGQSAGGVRGAVGSATSLTIEDAEAISQQFSNTTVSHVSPEFSSRSQVIAGKNNTNTSIIGVLPEYQTMRNLEISTGTFITSKDVTSVRKIAVLGPTVAATLFEEVQAAVGQSIRVNGQMLYVIGVTVSKGGTGFNNPDDVIYVPLTTAQKQLFGRTNLTSIAVEAKEKELMIQAQNEIGYMLLKRHKLSDPSQADFVIFSQNDILNTASQVTGTFTMLLGGIAAISLLVGGIGIMNIMLVTVTERTREIGLRKALGAKKKVLIVQFLIESILLTLTGGMFGVLIGVAISYGISLVVRIPAVISPGSIILAIGVSGGIGIIFGLYPARKAANLQPIEALRYE